MFNVCYNQIQNLFGVNYENTFTNKYTAGDKFKEDKKLYAKTYKINENKFNYTVDSGNAMITGFLGRPTPMSLFPKN